MKSARFLMCPPRYYDVVYEINPWMCVERRVDSKLAAEQWKALHGLLTGEMNAGVELIDPQPGVPDMVFTANAGLVRDNRFVRSRFRHPERRGEETHFEKWFRQRKYRVHTINEPFYFEGEGDALFMRDEIYTAYHFRSDIEAHNEVAAIFGKNCFQLNLVRQDFYHLDTCFAPLNDESALVFFDAFDPYAAMIVRETIKDPVSVPEDEALKFACNAVIAERKIVLPSGCPETAAALEKRGFRVYSLDFSEFIKAGGAAKCLVLRL